MTDAEIKIEEETLSSELSQIVLAKAALRTINELLKEDNNVEQETAGTSEEAILVKPKFSSIIVKGWEVSNPITLVNGTFLNSNISGIQLDKGFYRIQYTGSGQSKHGNGLATFEPENKRVHNLIVWKFFISTTNETQHFEGSRYIELHTPKILGIVDNIGNLAPKIPGVYVISIYRLKRTP